MKRPAEQLSSKLINFWTPLFICSLIFITSLYFDLIDTGEKMFWLQRSGAIITILGTWTAYHESKESMKIIGNTLFIETQLIYKIISLILIVIGTVLWGYGDIPFRNDF